MFVWCFFLALFEVEGWADQQSAHFFIDDPVSSLDDHNIFITASTFFDLIEEHYEKRKFIITTHHLGLFSILADWLTKIKSKYPIIWTDVLTPYSTTVTTNATLVVFGALNYWWFGEHGQPRMDFSSDVYFATDELATRFIEEIDFDYADKTAATAIVTPAA